MSEKIRVEHLKRAAYVYIRQSSSYQVRFHLEGQKRQYGLAERARQLGFNQVVVIDEDGISHTISPLHIVSIDEAEPKE